MCLHVSFNLPIDLDEKVRGGTADINAAAKQAFALSLFKAGKLTHVELANTLGLDRFETDALLKREGVFEGSLSLTDLEDDRQTIDKLMNRAG